MSEINEIVIDLVNPKYGFSANELIHQNEFLTITKLIDDQLSEDENQKSSEDGCQNRTGFVFPNINRTIMLNGARGTGKTTFLQTVIRDLTNKTRANQNGEKFCDSLEILDYLDPTLIEEKSSIFLTIISLIRNRVQDKLYKCCDKEIALNKRKAWQTSLDKFARGLPSIDENTKNKSADYWDDATQIMEKGLEDVNAAFNLRKNFSAFLKESLEILGKKSFLLVIDDVDTDPNKAWPLLETLRKYLSVNGIITVVSGDLQLFATVVRNKQGSRFTKTDKNNSLVEAQIEELSNQYLKKVLPIRYRISLPRLSQLIISKNRSDGEHLCVKYKANEAGIIPVKEFIRRVFYKLGIANNFQREGYTDFLLNLPLRTQIDWMRLFQNYGDEDTFKISEPFEPEHLVSLFIDELLQNDIDINLLVYNPNFINSIIIDFLIDKDILTESYQLQATSKDSSVNAVLFSLSMILSRSILDKPSLIFDNLIKVGYLRNLKSLFNKDENSYSFKNLTTHMGVTNDKDVRQMVCLATAYLRGMLKNKELAGVIKLSDVNFLLHKKEIELSDYIARLPYSNSMVGKGIHEYSIYTLLGAINDLIRDFESGDNLLKVLQRISQPREYAAALNDADNETPQDSLAEKNDDTKDENNDEESVSNESDFKTMQKELKDWLKDTKREKCCIASHVLAKVATRLYYTFNNISKETTLGDAMHLYIIALFNSVLIEEVMELTAGVNSDFEDIKITNRSVRTSPKLFIKNLKAITPALKSQKLPLTRIILTCPIFIFFINFESKGNGSEELLETYKDIKQNDFNEAFYKSKGCYSKLKEITQKEEIIVKEKFSSKNFNNIIDIIKNQFSYDTFMTSVTEDFKSDIFKIFDTASKNYQTSLNSIRKKITDKNIKW